ncbi:hypothetical protein RHMOL_Rhmol02G0001800 [Rhododendron molle]|uniref:Uncharacterized protein n=1 Tax=Rhododendron molle TaxID=49168 RepID=A0ACC0PLQ4_RHOML|nr:hypothetical protein RHMOL_Rhmol02G0001800 [Rhododendron molle]
MFPHVEDYLIVVQSLVQVFFKQLETSKSMGAQKGRQIFGFQCGLHGSSILMVACSC